MTIQGILNKVVVTIKYSNCKARVQSRSKLTELLQVLYFEYTKLT